MNGGLVGRFRGPLGFQKALQSDREQIEAFRVKPTSVSGRELVKQETRAGEALIDISFPVWFTEIPCMTFGGELAAGDFVQDRRYPTISVIVVEWTKKQADRIGGGYYVGARVAVVTTGKTGQQIWAHWRAEGKAMRTPLVDMNGTSL